MVKTFLLREIQMPLYFRHLSSFWLRACIIYFLILHQQEHHCQGAPLEVDEYSCNICRDPPAGERVLINPSKTFTQSNGVTVSCGELQEWVQDVAPTDGTAAEARYCELVQYSAWLNCDCIGPDIPSPIDDVKDLNPVCNLCGKPGLDFNFVPQPNKNKLTDTGCCGRQNCEILYYGASQGVLSANLCAIVQEQSGSDCCNLDSVEPPSISDNDTKDNYKDNEEDEMEDDMSNCQDDPTFRFKGIDNKNCDWIAAKKNPNRFCKRKSFGVKVWRSCPKLCGKCPLNDK